MTDVVDRTTRSRMMAGIRGRNTKPEMFVRSSLHRLGFRYRVCDRSLPGRPDLVFPGLGAVVMVHGCFWHGHDCALFKWPRTRPDFWTRKIRENRERDERNRVALSEAGWRVAEVWECAMKGPGKIREDVLVSKIVAWLRSGVPTLLVRGSK